ncbi:DJ-1/PfpI family protein [Gorillibacterium timonense]|uniref:DJ-1/PfpI family protein n=1 Tax=Gorillibacterium timonense TaxID=1689269 RepID=UPI00071D0E7D|nr:DJ-1/PfpI family protein [Gorillibacterium timonense]
MTEPVESVEFVESKETRRVRKVAILLFDDIEVLDFAGPYEVFAMAGKQGGDFELYTVAEEARIVTAVGGLRLVPDYAIGGCPVPDLLIVPGGMGTRREISNRKLLDWIAATASECELLLSVCTGALLLAAAGLLDGLEITTHHASIPLLRELAPRSAKIREDARYTDNGHILLSAGVSAGIDISLHAIEKLLGEERALLAAGQMEYDWEGAETERMLFD